MWFALLLLLSSSAYADEFEYSRFFQAKTLVKEALEKQTLKATKFKSIKELQTGIVSLLTTDLLYIKSKYNIDFAVISNSLNNSDELLKKGITFVTVKLKYGDEKGEIFWELTSVMTPNMISFHSVVDDGVDIKGEDSYNYKRLYKQ